jgi:hypothetical protein
MYTVHRHTEQNRADGAPELEPGSDFRSLGNRHPGIAHRHWHPTSAAHQ